jgi:hypothetical protein
MITPLLPFLSLSRMSYHPPPAYVQMNCEMDRITAAFFASQMPYPPPSAYAQMLWKMDHATSTFCYGG